jgi:SAM-dependent methyltransferase
VTQAAEERAELYDRLPLLEADQWWIDQARSAPGGHVLEFGAAAGRLTRAFVSAGCRVTAVERVPEMVARLRARTAAVATQVEVVAADAGELGGSVEAATYGLVALPSSLLNEAEDLEARQRVLAAAATRCRPDGHVALQLLGPWWLVGLPARSAGRLFPAEGGRPIEVAIEDVGFDAGSGRRSAELTYRFPDGTRHRDRLDVSVVTPAELRLLCGSVGLEIVAQWGALPPAPVSASDPVWHLLARPSPSS